MIFIHVDSSQAYCIKVDGRVHWYTELTLYLIAGIFQGLIWGQGEQKLLKMVYIIPNFSVLHFGENFMKIRIKIAKLQMHENLHKNMNENMVSFTFYKNFHELL